MGSKPRNYPKSVTIIQPNLSSEENKAAIKRIQDVLALIMIDSLIKKKKS